LGIEDMAASDATIGALGTGVVRVLVGAVFIRVLVGAVFIRAPAEPVAIERIEESAYPE
jgi:hypothetical protein